MPEKRPEPDLDEEKLVGWLRRQIDPVIGDDCALLDWHGPLALTTDTQTVGVHLPEGIEAPVAARRLLFVNLSDLAAVGAEPKLALLALAAPRSFEHRRFLRALAAAADRFGVRLVGGDVSSASTLTATLTLLGTRPHDRHWLTRCAARPGDGLWIGGPLGESALGLELVRRGARLARNRVELPARPRLDARLERAARRAVRRHLEPRPQLGLGRWLAEQRTRVAAIDVSDGLGKDLARLCAASGTGALVRHVEIPPARHELARRLGVDALELALGGGEDYALLFTLAPGLEPPRPLRCTRLGEVTGDGAILFEAPDGPREISGVGFDHLRA